MQQESEDTCLCPLEGIIDIISKKWALLTIATIGNHKKLRFNQILKDLKGISPKTLADLLKRLEGIGLIRSKFFAEISPRVDYSLTEDGVELRKAIRPLLEWASIKQGEKYLASPCLKEQ